MKLTQSRAGQVNKTTMWFIVGFIVIVTAGVIIAGGIFERHGIQQREQHVRRDGRAGDHIGRLD